MPGLEWILFGLRLLATVVLYTFLGVAFYIIWKDLRQVSGAGVPRPQTRYRLRVVASNGDSALGVGQTLPLQPVTLLGRDAQNTIIVNDAAASGHHARIRQENGIWWLEDLSSRNGTLLNELPLSKPASLTEGDVIGIGNLRLKLELAGNS